MELFASQYVGARAGCGGEEKYENRADCTAHGERAAEAVWRNRANCLLSHRRTGPAGSRGDPVRERRFGLPRQSRALRADGAASRRECPRHHSLLHADARPGARARRRIRHSALPHRPVSLPAVSADCASHALRRCTDGRTFPISSRFMSASPTCRWSRSPMRSASRSRTRTSSARSITAFPPTCSSRPTSRAATMWPSSDASRRRNGPTVPS